MTRAITPEGPTADEFAAQLFGSFLGSMETLSCYVGERLGWYAALAQSPCTPAELAERTGTDARYAREWLELQAAYGVLQVEPDERDDAAPRVFVLPPGPREVLLDTDSLAYLGALPRLLAAAGRVIDPLLQAYRDGGGLGWSAYGPDAYESQALLNRPWFLHALAPALRGLPEIDTVLGAEGARILDVGCGGGWASIALAQACPHAEVIGLDVDTASLELAQANAAAAGVLNVSFVRGDAADWPPPASFDAILLLECLHDMPRPVEVLTALRAALRPGGLLVVMDEAVADQFSAPADEVDRLMYGFSLFVCLPDGRSSEPSAATGTVLRPSILADYARRAGFTAVTVLPVTDFGFFRFYQLS